MVSVADSSLDDVLTSPAVTSSATSPEAKTAAWASTLMVSTRFQSRAIMCCCASRRARRSTGAAASSGGGSGRVALSVRRGYHPLRTRQVLATATSFHGSPRPMRVLIVSAILLLAACGGQGPEGESGSAESSAPIALPSGEVEELTVIDVEAGAGDAVQRGDTAVVH